MHLERELNNLKEIHGERRNKRMSQLSKIRGFTMDQQGGVPNHFGPQLGNILNFEPTYGNLKLPLPFGSPKNGSIDPSPSSVRRRKPKRIMKKRVILEEIKPKVDALTINLLLRKTTLDQLCNQLENSCGEEGRITIERLKQLFESPPFSESDQIFTEKLARYMIEDNSEPKVAFDDQMTGEWVVLKTVLRRMFEYYVVPSDLQVQELHSKVKKRLSVNYRRIGYDMAGMKTKLGDTCNRDQIIGLLSSYDVATEPFEINFVLVKLFELSGNLQKLPYFELFHIFQAEPLPEED